MVKTHVKTKLSVCLFSLAQGCRELTGGIVRLPDGAGVRVAERALDSLPHTRARAPRDLQDLCDLHVHPASSPTFLSPISPGSVQLSVFVDDTVESRCPSRVCFWKKRQD